MRLIDADTLKKSIICSDTDELKILSTKQLHEILDKWIDDRETVDAIPVDWMLQRMNETASGEGLNVELNNALFAVGVEWERSKMDAGVTT